MAWIGYNSQCYIHNYGNHNIYKTAMMNTMVLMDTYILIKNIKQHLKKILRSSVSPTHQDLSNDTTLSQIKSHVPVPLNKPT